MNLEAIERATNRLFEIERDRGAFLKTCEEFGRCYSGVYDPSKEILFVDACTEAFRHLVDFEVRRLLQEIRDAAA